MDNELKELNELENQIKELKTARDKELLKAEILNNMIEKANEQQGLNIKKIKIAISTDSSQTKE